MCIRDSLWGVGNAVSSRRATVAKTLLAVALWLLRSRNLLDLLIFQLHRRGAAEDRHGDAQAGAFLVDLFDHPVEALERAIGCLLYTSRLAMSALQVDGGDRIRPGRDPG